MSDLDILTEFGEENDGWDVDGTGLPGEQLAARAIQFWSCRQIALGRPNTVQVAAVTFGMTEALVRHAVNAHPWMFVGDGDVIEHEGE